MKGHVPPMRAKELRVYPVGGRHFLFAPRGRGEELRLRLEEGGVQSVVSRIPGVVPDRLELVGDVDLGRVQTILDNWRR